MTLFQLAKGPDLGIDLIFFSRFLYEGSVISNRVICCLENVTASGHRVGISAELFPNTGLVAATMNKTKVVMNNFFLILVITLVLCMRQKTIVTYSFCSFSSKPPLMRVSLGLFLSLFSEGFFSL